MNPQGNILSIGMNQLAMLMSDLGCLDEGDTGTLKSTDSDRLFITVNAGRRSAANPANAFVRLQLVEFITRCAIEKFFASGQVETELEAV